MPRSVLNNSRWLFLQQLAELVVLPQANPRQAFWQWVAKHKKGYTNDLKVGI